MNFKRFRDLSAHHRALVAAAVLFDGHEAAMYLANDSLHNNELAEISSEISELPPEFRNMIAGHHFRVALEDLAQRRAGEISPDDTHDQSLLTEIEDEA